MLDSVAPGVIAEWEAFDRIEPFGDEQLTRLFLYALAAMGAESDWEMLRRREPVDADEAEQRAIDETAEAISRAFGMQDGADGRR